MKRKSYPFRPYLRSASNPFLELKQTSISRTVFRPYDRPTLDVVMKLNNLLQLKTAIINNLLAQEIVIPVETLKMILDFLMKDHEETNQKFYLQAFLYTTKRNLTLDYDAEK